MSYHTYVTANHPLPEKELVVEWLSIQEAIDKKMSIPAFFNASELSQKELNEPGVVAFMPEGFGLAITLSDTQLLKQISQKTYSYNVQLISDDALQTTAVYTQLATYLKTEVEKGASVQLWEVLDGKGTPFSINTLALSDLTTDTLAQFFEEELTGTKCLDFSQN